MTWPYTVANESFLQFDDDDKIKYSKFSMKLTLEHHYML